MEWLRKLRGWLRRGEIEDALREEMETHVEMKASATGDERGARTQFGNTTLLLEDSRSAWGWPGLEACARDLRYAMRLVIRRPAMSATVVLTLALGISASSTIYSLADTVLIRPLPYPDSERLVAIHEAKPGEPLTRTRTSPARLEDWRSMNRTLESIAASNSDTFTDTTEGAPERLAGAFVSPGFFETLRIAPALGRVFSGAEQRYGGPLAVVISDGLWRRRFAADRGVPGRRMRLADRSYTIVGVMPPSFRYPEPTTDVWAARQARPELMQIREARFYACFGRLKADVRIEQAQADMQRVQRELASTYPKTDAGWTIAAEPLKDLIVGRTRGALALLLGAVSLLLLIACANVACLLLARLNGRASEMATRVSLGAGRAALARQLFAEGLVYSLAGGLLGSIAVYGGVALLREKLPTLPRIAELEVDLRALALIAGISILTAILFSLAPVIQTFRRDLRSALTRGGRGVAAGAQRLPRALVAAQLALATALMIGAGLFLRSLANLEDAPLGFHPEEVLTLRIGASFNERPAATVERHRRTMEAFAAVPGVTSVAMATGLPSANPGWPREFEIAGDATPHGTMRFVSWRIVTSGYFETVGMRMVEGRTCRMDPDPARSFEVVVNRRFAERYFGGRAALGQRILRGPLDENVRNVVGVVEDAREDGHAIDPQPFVYACGYLRFWPDSAFLIQTRDPAAIAGAVQQAARAIEPSRPVYAVQPLSSALERSLAQTRFRTLLVSLFSMLALALAAVGLYGVMAYMVSQRTREIGIQIALGARPGRIVGEVVRSGGALAVAGAVLGIGLAAGLARLSAALLYGVRPTDAGTYASAAGVLLAVALLACLIPGRRATSVDPIQALREQ